MDSKIQDVQGSKRKLQLHWESHMARQNILHWPPKGQGSCSRRKALTGKGQETERKQWSRTVQLQLCQTRATKQNSRWFMVQTCHFHLKKIAIGSHREIREWRESVAMRVSLRRSGCRRSGFSLQQCPQGSSTIWVKLLTVFSVSLPNNRSNWPRKMKFWLVMK